MPRIDWPVKTLGDICELVSRGRPPSYCEDGGIIVLNQKCVRNGKIDFGPSRRTDNNVKAIPEWAYLRKGDTLINSTGAGTLGRTSFVSILNEPTTFDTHLTVVRPRKDLCWPAFIGLALNGREKDIVELAGGSTGQTELPREAVRSFEIPVPPLDEQKRIVALLDAATARVTELTACYEKARTHANNLFTSALRDALEGKADWPVKTLGDLMTVQNGYAFDSKYFSPVGKIGLIRIRDLRGGVDTEARYDGPFSDEYEVSAGDYLIGMDGEFRCYEWKGEPALLNQRVCRLQGFSKSLESRFLYYGINKFLKDIEDVTGYTTVKHLSSKSILAIEMSLPPLAEQKQIVARLDLMRAKTSEMVAAYDAKLTAAKNLRQSILEAAFAGDL